MIEDDVLWSGMMEGDKDMYLALYRKYYHALLFIGLKEIGDACLVKDAIQQQFLYLWEKREGIGPARNVRSYLITSFLRRLNADWKKAGKPNSLQVAWNYHEKELPPTPEEDLIRKDDQLHLSKLLLQMLGTLPSRQKELIVLKFYEGLSYDQIAERTGLTHRTIYNKIHEGLKALKSGMDKQEGRSHYSSALSVILAAMMASSLLN